MDLLLRMFFLESVDQVQFGTDGPFGTGRCISDRLNDLAGGTRDVGDIVYFLRAFGMDEYLDARVIFTERGDVVRLEHLMHRAVPLPENHA